MKYLIELIPLSFQITKTLVSEAIFGYKLIEPYLIKKKYLDT